MGAVVLALAAGGAWYMRGRPPAPPRQAPASGAGEVLRRLEGLGLGDAFGSYVTSGQDLDGDGVPDLVIGAPEDRGGGAQTGTVVVVSGRTGGELWRAHGDRAGAFLGERVAVGPDLDGDGAVDVLARARGTAARGDRVVAFGGRTGAPIRTFTGGSPQDELGTSMAALPDLDGDGVGDLAIGAPAAFGAPFAGLVHIVSGGTGLVLRSLTGPGYAQDRFGFAMAVVGDQDGDGVVDLAVTSLGGATRGANAGAVHVLSVMDGRRLRRIEGATAGDQFGHELAAVPDIDGNGRPELLAGSFLPSGIGYVQLLDPLTGVAHRVIRGAESGDAFGHTVALIGDLDGDGVPEWAIGAPDAAHPATGYAAAGRVFIHAGRDGARLGAVNGDLERAHFGYSFAEAGDPDGDGRVDLFVGTVVEGARPGQALVVSPARALATRRAPER